MRDTILEKLNQIERQEHVYIFFACESGSRAWGFPSADSDYDVRFLYLRPPEWYLSINVEKKRDVIEYPISDALDVSGWDLKKALQLFRKSNPPLLEWLNSPITYLEKSSIANDLRALIPQYYSPQSCFYHYLNMARNNYKRNVKGAAIKHKAYFYILRPILACTWIEEERGVVPTEFERLFYTLVDDDGLQRAVEALLERKRSGSEMDYGPVIPEVSDFIETEMARLEGKVSGLRKNSTTIENLDMLFRSALDKVWS